MDIYKLLRYPTEDEARKFFREADRDGSKRINIRELSEKIRQRVPTFSNEDALLWMNSIDKDGSCYIDEDEFALGAVQSRMAKLRRMFEKLDVDRSNSLSITEFSKLQITATASAGEKHDTLFKRLNTKADGQLSFDEFLRLVSSLPLSMLKVPKIAPAASSERSRGQRSSMAQEAAAGDDACVLVHKKGIPPAPDTNPGVLWLTHSAAAANTLSCGALAKLPSALLALRSPTMRIRRSAAAATDMHTSVKSLLKQLPVPTIAAPEPSPHTLPPANLPLPLSSSTRGLPLSDEPPSESIQTRPAAPRPASPQPLNSLVWFAAVGAPSSPRHAPVVQRCVRELPMWPCAVTAIAVDDACQCVIVASAAGTIALRPLHAITSAFVFDAHPGPISALITHASRLYSACRPQASCLSRAAASRAAAIKVWSVPQLMAFPPKPASRSARQPRPAPSSPLAILSGHTAPLTALALLTDHWLASTSVDGTLRLWRIPQCDRGPCFRISNSPLLCCATHPQAAHAPHATIVAGAQDGNLHVIVLQLHAADTNVEYWPVERRRHVVQAHSCGVVGVSLSPAPPGATTIAWVVHTCSSSGSIKIWSIAPFAHSNDGPTHQPHSSHTSARDKGDACTADSHAAVGRLADSDGHSDSLGGQRRSLAPLSKQGSDVNRSFGKTMSNTDPRTCSERGCDSDQTDPTQHRGGAHEGRASLVRESEDEVKVEVAHCARLRESKVLCMVLHRGLLYCSVEREHPVPNHQTAARPTAQQNAVLQQYTVLVVDANTLSAAASVLGHSGAVQALYVDSAGYLHTGGNDAVLRVWK